MRYRNILLMAGAAGLAGMVSDGIAGAGLKRPAVSGAPFTMSVPAAVQTRADPVALQDGGFEASYKHATEDYLINDFWAGGSTNYGTPFCDLATCGREGQNNGDFWVWFAWHYKIEQTFVEQTVLVPAGASVMLRFYLSLPDCAEAGDYSFDVSMNDKVIWGFDQDSAPAECNQVGYTPVMVDISDLAGTVQSLEFAATMDFGVDTNIFIDDVAITTGQYSYFRPGQALTFPPPAADCDSTTPNTEHFGRMIVDQADGGWWICTDAGWKMLETNPL